MQIDYHVELADPHAHEFSVHMNLSDIGPGPLRLSLPAWIPGSYMIRDFARNIRDLRVTSPGLSLSVDKIDKQTWLIPAPRSELEIAYRVYALDLSVRSAYFDDTRAYFNGTSLFLRVHGEEDQPHRVTLRAPSFKHAQEWKVATSLPALDTDERGFGRYQADGYEALIDYPVEMAAFREATFLLQGVPHRMVFVDAQGADIDRIARELPAICAEHVAMFGELPVDGYLFQTLATRDGYGGLEHRDSTSLICKRSDLPWPGGKDISKGYRQYLALCSHEYFHQWNVKRIRPAAFADLDLSQEKHTELLWAFEGITSYYDELALPRSGVLPRSDYLDMLAPSLTRYFRNAGRRRQSVAESSFDAWTKFYKQDESAPNAIVSYYNKGALVALGLDLLIRLESDDKLTLDDLMRHLWRHYGQTGTGVPERAIESDIAQLIGRPVDQFFERYIYGVEELPLEEWLAGFGVGMNLRPAGNAQDQGGFVEQAKNGADTAVSLGARLGEENGLLKVEVVFAGGAAEQAGLTPGDLLVALNGERCTQDGLQELLARHPAGASADLTLFRRDRLRVVQLPILAAPGDTVELYWLDEAALNEKVIRRREQWLSSSAKLGDG